MNRRAILLSLMAATAAAQDGGGTQPALPPEPRPLMLAPFGDVARPRAAEAAARVALGEDLDSLKRATERVRLVLDHEAVAHGGDRPVEHGAAPADPAQPEAAREPVGPVRNSPVFTLAAQRWSDGGVTLTADIRQERLERVYREVGLAIGRPIDDSRLMGSHGLASLRVADLPWQEALDRLLGQAGLYWREEGEGAAAKIVVLDPAIEPAEPARIERLAARALGDAARIDGPVAMEAIWLMGEHDARAGRSFDAIRHYHRLIQAHASSKDPRARGWVLKALRGVGDEMSAVGRHQDARAVYIEWIGRAQDDDPALAAVYLACADQSLALARERDDPGAVDEAIDLLHVMLERCAEHERWTADVARARLILGELLLNQGRHREASIQLARFAESSGAVGDQVSFWMAECDFAAGAAAKALPIYERLAAKVRADGKDATAADEVYATSAFRVGQCHLEGPQPKHVHALFAFLRAHQEHPKGALEAEILVNIARCYAELEREDDAVQALLDLLRTDAALDPRPGRLQIDQLLGDLEGRIAAYPGPIRARVLFHIAQANYRQAVRDRGERERLVGEAMQRYERVIAENAPPDLAAAARLGLARVAFLGDREVEGERVARALLADRSLSQRDRDFAAQLLGNHYRAKGRMREAIAAYAGELP